jgi:RimJ/RimL family protein N-acetyltransferase
LGIWQERAAADTRNVAWGPRALVDRHQQMVGHAGFHLPPRPLAMALDDPTFVGRRDPDVAGVVEIGYAVFPRYRGQGYATEAVAALVDWAARTGEVGAIVAAIACGNDGSVRVLERVGGFLEIGTARNEDGEVEVVYRRDIQTPSAQ